MDFAANLSLFLSVHQQLPPQPAICSNLFKMVSFTLPALATLALAALTTAAPTTQTDSVEVFSFSKWVDGIIANPHGDNLTPEEAVEAYYKSVNASEAAALDWDYGRARKRDEAAEGATPEWDYGKRDEVPEAASPDWDYGRVRKRATCNTIAGTQASVRFFTVPSENTEAAT